MGLIESLIAVLTAVFIGIGAGVGGPFLLSHQGKHSAQRHAYSSAGIGPQNTLQFFQDPYIVLSSPELDPFQNPPSLHESPATFNHEYKDTVKFSGQCTDSVRAKVATSELNHLLVTRNGIGYSATSQARQHTLMHIDCPACESNRRIAMGHEELRDMPFRNAADVWVEMRRMYLQPRTTRDNRQYIKTLSAFLGDMKLAEMTIGTVRSYQQWRLDSDISATRINHEVSCLGQILKEAGLWHKILPYYKPIPVTTERVGVALTEEQIRKLFEAARKDTRWEVALHASILSANTTCGPGEIKGLRIGDIDIPNRLMHVRKGKNQYRVRTIPLNDDAIRSARYLLERAKDKGATIPEHYLLPHRAAKRGQGYDPERPQGHWNRAWDRVRCKAGLPHLRQYDLRHTAITRLLENPTVSERVVIELAGHVSNKMLERYSHQRIEAKRQAVGALDDLASNWRGIKVINRG